jgi:hypothetical protein
MSASKANRSRLRVPALAVLAACLASPILGSAPALAQDEGPLTLDVKRVVIPDTRQKLASKGVRVRASCSRACVLVVKIKLPKDVARELGLGNRVIGSGAAGAKADRPRWVRARLNRGAGRALSDFGGSGRLEVRIRALP